MAFVAHAQDASSVRSVASANIQSPDLKPTSLTLGATSDLVGTYQQELSKLGFYTGKITNTYDRATQEAVKAFQETHQISADGILGTSTGALINQSVAVTTPDPRVIIQASVAPTSPSQGLVVTQTQVPVIAQSTVQVTPACNASPVSILSDSKTTTAGWTNSNPSSDPLNVSLYNRHSFIPATEINQNSSWVAPVGLAKWISDNASEPGLVGGEGLATEDQWRLFQQVFTAPTASPITLYYSADNAVNVYLNGVQVGSSSDVSVFGAGSVTPFHVFEHTYQVVLNPQIGSNVLDFVVRNVGGTYTHNPTGLMFYTMSAQPNCSTPSVPSMSGYSGLVGSLRPGLRSNARVMQIQTTLENLGLYSGLVDGNFGSKTKAAIATFQAAHHLKSDGIVGPITWNAVVNAGSYK